MEDAQWLLLGDHPDSAPSHDEAGLPVLLVCDVLFQPGLVKLDRALPPD